jgi:hypothetical protein
MWSSTPQRASGDRSESEPFYANTRRIQQGKAGGDRRSECAGETIPSNFEFPELVQQDKVTSRCDIPPHRGRSGNGADSIKVTHSHAGA